MSDPKQILEALKVAKEQAAINPDNVEYRIRPAVEMQKMRGQEQVSANRNAYYNWVKDESGACIILEGSPEAQAKFAKLAAEVGGTINVDAMAFYKRLCENFWAASGGRGSIGYEEITAILRRIDDACRRLGIKKYLTPGMGILFQRTFHSELEIAEAIRVLMREIDSDGINAASLLQDIVTLALEAERAEQVVPVVILNAIGNEGKVLADTMFGSTRSVTIKVSEEPTEKEVLTAFKTLKNTIKGKVK